MQENAIIEDGVGRLSFNSVDNIIRQREEFLKRQRGEICRVWGQDFDPFPILDKIAKKIVRRQVDEVSNLLEKTCDGFIDSIVRSEFYPEE
jgi:hypothetical protein